jgi:hypothetical protein
MLMSLCCVSCFTYCYAKCHFAECRYAECRYAECSGAYFIVENVLQEQISVINLTHNMIR